MIKRRWIIYTVLIGLIPFVLRSMIYLFTKQVTGVYVLNEIDFISFGLILNLTNINELEGIENVDKVWKMTRIGLSVVLLIVFAAFLLLAYLSEVSTGFEKNNIKYGALILSGASLVFSYSIYNRINALP